MSKNTIPVSQRRRPRIGLTMRLAENGDFYLRREYSEAIEALGGVPLMLPLIPLRESVEQLADELDGILLPGSDSDVDPLLYASEPRPHLGRVEPLRDEMDLLLLAAAEKRSLPVLGICFGMQSLNVARGGKLVQDIETEIANPLAHRQIGGPPSRRSHYITIEAESRLAKLSGCERLLVNSHHHQAILTAGENLRIVGRSADGVIEAVEDVRESRFVIGVQWHPELDWQRDEFSQSLFQAFLSAAAEFRAMNLTSS